jgi:predicted ATPase/class 3 adenylate cyclase
VDVAVWLRELGLERYEQAFRDNDIDSEILASLTAEDLTAIGVTSVGHRRKLLVAIAALAAEPSEPAEAAPTAAPAPAREPEGRRPARSEAERRQLTVMFVDLVGFTPLSRGLDPEDLREVLRVYQDTVAGEVARYDGHIARLIGDGVLAYFGYPRAHEDDAERAVRAGLALTAAVGKLAADGDPLAARIGIATGLVVVGDLTGEAEDKDAVVGETPNLAARLQELAEPGAVVVAPGTRRLLGGLFELVQLEERELKGFAEPVRAWRVVRESAAESRFEAFHGERLARLVGREPELGILLERWAWAKDGDGQVVLLSGEPGIGKSRITRELDERLLPEPHARLSYSCSPFHTNSALHPMLQQLERSAGFDRDDPAERKLDKLEAILGPAAEPHAEVAALLAHALSIPVGDRYPALELSPQQEKQRTFQVLIARLCGFAAAGPVLMIFEDAQWIDPTTQELLGLITAQVESLPVLLLITFRPEFRPPWAGLAHATSLTLNRLGQRQGALLAQQVAGEKALPAEVLSDIVAKTEGVPLFVEELTKAVLESGVLEETGDAYVLAEPLRSLAIPNTLQDSLMARLDRLAPTKEIAQIGAVIGREFSYDLIRAVSRRSESELDRALTDLVNSELVMRRGAPPDATFVFKHVLVQDAAYASLLRDRRRHLHARIAIVLEEQSPQTLEQQPELIAHHFGEAGLFEQAATYWLRAGQRAAEHSANTEAITHLMRCVEVLERLPDTPERARRELTCQLALGPALLATRGWSALQAVNAYRRARDLAEQLGEDRERFNALWGLWLFHTTRGEIEVAAGLTDELFAIAERLDDPALRLQAHHAAWADSSWLGDPKTARDHVRQGLAIYDPEAHRAHALLYGGHDPGVCGKGQGGLSLWLLGYPDQAMESVREAIVLAEQLEHAPSLAHALLWTMLCHQFRREAPAALASSERLIALAAEQELQLYGAGGLVVRGWALVSEGRGREGLAELHRGLDAYAAIEIGLLSSYFKAALAESCHRTGEAESAMMAIDDALSLAARTAEHFWEAAMLHLKSEIFLSFDPPDQAQAEASLQAAIDLARKQGGKSLELRATTALARLRAGQGRRAEARDLLAPVYGWFTEGFETADLRDAKALLDALG